MNAESDGETESQVGGWRGGVSRRTFLRRGTFTAAAVAVAGSVPVSTLLATTATEAPAVDNEVSGAADEAGELTEPLVAQVKDPSTGEISLFQGEREVVVRSPALARGLMSAARKQP
jgi:hypothetical protein